MCTRPQQTIEMNASYSDEEQQRAERDQEGPAVHPVAEEHQGGARLPQEADQLYGEAQHAHREATHARIQAE